MDTRTRERISLILNCEPDAIPESVLKDVELFQLGLSRIGVGTPTDRELVGVLMLCGHLKFPEKEVSSDVPAKPQPPNAAK